MSHRCRITLFLVCTIVVFLSQPSLSATLKHQSTVQNSDTTEATIKQAKSTNNIFLDESKIIDAIGSMNTVKLETTLNFLGSTLIRELESNGFSVNEDTTMKELLNIIDPDNFIVNWATENPQEMNQLLNKIIKKLISATNNTDITPSLRHVLEDYHKLIGVTSMPETRLPRSAQDPDPYHIDNRSKDKKSTISGEYIAIIVIGSLLITVATLWCSCQWLYPHQKLHFDFSIVPNAAPTKQPR